MRACVVDPVAVRETRPEARLAGGWELIFVLPRGQASWRLGLFFVAQRPGLLEAGSYAPSSPPCGHEKRSRDEGSSSDAALPPPQAMKTEVPSSSEMSAEGSSSTATTVPMRIAEQTPVLS